MNVKDYINWIISQIGSYYWYGTFGQKASYKLYDEKKVQYPKYYTANDFSEQIKNPKSCFDCAGLVKSLFVYPIYNAGDDLGATGLYGKCTVKGKLDRSLLKPGYLVFKGNDKTKSHVGIFIGDNKIVEAKNHASGVIESELNDSWNYYAQYYKIDYSEESPVIPSDPEDTELKFDSDICKYCKGINLTVNTNKDPLRLRSTPKETKDNIITLMPKGSKVIWYGYYVGNWYKVRFGDMVGFAWKDYLKM